MRRWDVMCASGWPSARTKTTWSREGEQLKSIHDLFSMLMAVPLADSKRLLKVASGIRYGKEVEAALRDAGVE